MKNLIDKVVSLYLKMTYNISIDSMIEKARTAEKMAEVAKKHAADRGKIEQAARKIKREIDLGL